MAKEAAGSVAVLPVEHDVAKQLADSDEHYASRAEFAANTKPVLHAESASGAPLADDAGFRSDSGPEAATVSETVTENVTVTETVSVTEVDADSVATHHVEHSTDRLGPGPDNGTAPETAAAQPRVKRPTLRAPRGSGARGAFAARLHGRPAPSRTASATSTTSATSSSETETAAARPARSVPERAGSGAKRARTAPGAAATTRPKRSQGARSAVVARGFVDQYRDNVTRLSTAQRPGAGVPAYTRFVSRPIGRRLAAVAAILRLTPNGVTLLSLLSWGLGLALLCLVEPSAYVAAGVTVLLLLGHALDSADGQLARLARVAGPAGEWVDQVADQLRAITMHLAVLIWLYRFGDLSTPTPYLIPLAWVVVVGIRTISQVLGRGIRRATPVATATGEVAEPPALLRTVALLPADMGLLCLVFVLVGTPRSFLTAYGALLGLNTLLALVSLRRRYVELRRLTRRTA